VGGGPGGLYAALLLKKADPARQITVIDRNPPGATYGWGVVFSDETLGFLEEADPETYEEIADSFVHWEAIDIHYRGEVVRSGGHAFSGIARTRLLDILQRRCRSLGVELQFEAEVENLSSLGDHDLIIAADGLNSRIRSEHTSVFKPSFDTHATKYIWLGAELPLDAFTFWFRQTEYGMFQVHAYPFERNTCAGSSLSTFIVECTEPTWRRAGLDSAGEEESLSFCQTLFGDVLQGGSLMSNRSAWINFVTLRNETWHYGNVVLLGDAAHTAHFSIGSGTKMAMEDAIALSEALERRADLSAALVEFEELRQPVVERTQQAARESSLWFENTARYARFEPVQFAFSLLTRSKRITYDNLKVRDPVFSNRVDRWFSRASSPAGTTRPAQPVLTSLRLRSLHLANRMVEVPPCYFSAQEGLPSAFHLVQLGSRAVAGAGLVMTEPVAVSAGGRITPGCAGLYCPEHLASWQRIVQFVQLNSRSKIALQLNHAGRRASTRARSEGVDRPLAEGNWPLLSASPLPYTPYSQTPKEMERADMTRVCREFVQAAAWAAEAGFDLLELHFGHGYLVAGFLSPLTNRRGDQYGGSLQNRLHFPLELLDAVREVWPEGRGLSACFSATDWARGGLERDDAIAIARAFKAHGCALVHVVTGQTTAGASPVYGRGWQARFADEIRNEAEVSTIVGGNITTPDEMNTILAAGRADLCILAPWTFAELGRSTPAPSRIAPTASPRRP
jgi:anthraniloyl-CoA monooxygenase